MLLDKDSLNKTLEAVKNEVLKRYDEIEEIYLFGSYAKGTANDKSDVDILVLLNNMPTLNQIMFAGNIYKRYMDKNKIKIHLLFENKKFFENNAQVYYTGVAKYGKSIYKKM